MSNDNQRAVANAVLLSRAPNLIADFGCHAFECYAEVLLECFLLNMSMQYQGGCRTNPFKTMKEPLHFDIEILKHGRNKGV